MKKKKLFIILSILILLFIAANYFLSDTFMQRVSYKDINSQELYGMLAKKDFFFVNVHIPYEGEIEKTDAFIPYNEIEKNLSRLPKDKNAKIVLYCKSGKMSTEASLKLTDLGYTKIQNLISGMHDWQSKGYPLINNKK